MNRLRLNLEIPGIHSCSRFFEGSGLYSETRIDPEGGERPNPLIDRVELNDIEAA